MAKTNTSQHSGHKRTSSAALSPRLTNKNRYTPIANHEDQNVDNLEEEDMDLEEVKQKIPPLYIYEIDD
ncbi:unnamed protein product [Macrosiphum euphorbiae]|nr:unnamed protein product [Macrosiphum euphorbiae]